jgi:hypothetical protein
MFKLNGGGTRTSGGTNYNGMHGGRPAAYDYGYDSDRDGTAEGITYHGRSNIQYEGFVETFRENTASKKDLVNGSSSFSSFVFNNN